MAEGNFSRADIGFRGARNVSRRYVAQSRRGCAGAGAFQGWAKRRVPRISRFLVVVRGTDCVHPTPPVRLCIQFRERMHRAAFGSAPCGLHCSLLSWEAGRERGGMGGLLVRRHGTPSLRSRPDTFFRAVNAGRGGDPSVAAKQIYRASSSPQDRLPARRHPWHNRLSPSSSIPTPFSGRLQTANWLIYGGLILLRRESSMVCLAIVLLSLLLKRRK